MTDPFARSPVSRRIFDALCDCPYGVTLRELADRVYGGDLGGGPDGLPNTMHVRIKHMNSALRAAGLGLYVRGDGGPGSRYRLYLYRRVP